MHYRINYITIVAVTFLFAFWRSFAMALAFTVLIPVWLYLLGARKQPLVIPMGSNGSKRLTKDETLYGLGAVSFIILWLAGSVMSSILALWIGAGICALHAIVRPPTVMAKLNNARFNLKTAIFGGNGDGIDDDDDEAFVVRDVAEGFKALLGMGKKKRGVSAAAAAKSSKHGRSSSNDGGMDVEGRAAPSSQHDSSSSSGRGGGGAYASPFMNHQPAVAPSSSSSGPVAGFYSGAPQLPPNMIPSPSPASSAMPVFYDAPLAAGGAGGANGGFDDGIGGGGGGLHARQRRGGGGGGAPNLPRPADVKSA